MTTSNLDAMLECGQASSEVNDRAIAILKADSSNETALRYKFIIGRIMSRDTSYETAADYAPAIDAKPGMKGKWQPFPVNEPTTFDAKVHRPLVIHNRYRAALTAWSQVRASAGLASLGGKREPRVDQGEKGEGDKPKVTPSGLAVETGLDTAAIVSHVQAFENWLERTLRANAKQIRGDAGSLLSEVEKSLRAHMVKLTNALASDTIPAKTVIEAKREADLKASNDALHAELAALKATVAAAQAPSAAPADAAVDEAAQVSKRARAKLAKAEKLAKAA